MVDLYSFVSFLIGISGLSVGCTGERAGLNPWFQLGAINCAFSNKYFSCQKRYPESDNCYDPFPSNSFSKGNFDIDFQWTGACLIAFLRAFAIIILTAEMCPFEKLRGIWHPKAQLLDSLSQTNM